MKMIAIDTAEKLIEFALQHGALIEQKQFNKFFRYIILTTRGLVALRSPLDTKTLPYFNKVVELKDFKGFNKHLEDIKKSHKTIQIANYNG